jgi:hypothetical protein
MAVLRVQITKYVMDHQPPIVACEFADADGRRHTVIDKVSMFSEKTLHAESQYPQDGVIRCTVLAEWRDATGRDVVKVSTAHPDQIESTEERTDFVVLRDRIAMAPAKFAGV